MKEAQTDYTFDIKEHKDVLMAFCEMIIHQMSRLWNEQKTHGFANSILQKA